MCNLLNCTSQNMGLLDLLEHHRLADILPGNDHLVLIADGRPHVRDLGPERRSERAHRRSHVLVRLLRNDTTMLDNFAAQGLISPTGTASIAGELRSPMPIPPGLGLP